MLSLSRSLIILDRSQFRGNHNYGLGSKHISSFFACLMVSCVRRMSTRRPDFYIELNIFFVPIFLCPSSFECPLHEKLYRVSRLHDSLSLTETAGRVKHSSFNRFWWKSGGKRDSRRPPQSSTVKSDALRWWTTAVWHTKTSQMLYREIEKGGIDKLMGITNAVRVPTQYVKEKKKKICRLFFSFSCVRLHFHLLSFQSWKESYIHTYTHCVCVCAVITSLKGEFPASSFSFPWGHR